VKTKKFPIPIYHGVLEVVLVDDMAEVVKKYYWIKEGDKYDGVAFVLDPPKGTIKYVVVLRNKSPDIIAHESVHICNMIFKEKGIKPDLENDEPQAYLTGWIVDKIMKTMNFIAKAEKRIE